MNPCTLGWYLPLLVKDVPGALQPSEPGHRVRSSNSAQSAPPQSHEDALDPQQQPAVNTAFDDGRGRGAWSEGLPKSGKPSGREKASGSGSSSASVASWQELDAKFRRDLPDDAYVQRLAYRGLVMRACANIKMLDGVMVSRKEKEKAERFLDGMAKAKLQRSA